MLVIVDHRYLKERQSDPTSEAHPKKIEQYVTLDIPTVVVVTCCYMLLLGGSPQESIPPID